jgi:hypothetical protein
MSETVVEEKGEGSFDVEVRAGKGSTRHTVVVPADYPAAIGWAGLPTVDLVRASFDFLLEREPATSILRRFRLDEIPRYFPEYPEEIRRSARRSGE